MLPLKSVNISYISWKNHQAPKIGSCISATVAKEAACCAARCATMGSSTVLPLTW
jgi:hypothetical protein